jgi:hypothetical protein
VDNRPSRLLEAVKSDLSDYVNPTPVGCVDFQPGISYKQFAANLLCHEIIRKYVPKDLGTLAASTYEKFTHANKKCGAWKLQLDDCTDELLVGEFRREIDLFFHPAGRPLVSSYAQILDRARTGPGSSIGAKHFSFYAKMYASPMVTTSPLLYNLYRAYVRLFPLQAEAELLRYCEYGDTSYVSGSRVSFVPKTDTSSRMICVEPNLNMYFQLGLGSLLEERLRSIGIDLSTQPEVNREMARRGSYDNSLSTIDLSSASDSISLRMCKEFLPAWFYQTLVELRSHTTTYKSDRVILNMVSTMGNGFTFPLQTVIFSCIVRAALRAHGLQPVAGENWSVFGDDIICSGGSTTRSVLRLLHILGFSINDSKTFVEGRFRESCGADWLDGRPVRAIYVKSLDSPQDLFVTINMLNVWSSYTGLRLPKAIKLLYDMLPHSMRFRVPFEWPIDSGIRVPRMFINAKYDRNGSIVFKATKAIPSYLRIMDGAFRGPRRVRELLYNPPGLYCSFLLGEWSAHKMAVRLDRCHYVTKLARTPRWDYVPSGTIINGVIVSWRRWYSAVRHSCLVLSES